MVIGGDVSARKSATFDHVIPKSKGGRRTAQNIVLACQDCNELKGDGSPETLRLMADRLDRVMVQRGIK